MRDLYSLIDDFRGWDTPREGSDGAPFQLACSVADGASTEEVSTAWKDMPVPPELCVLWACARTARLFEDIEYGQWGLKLLSPTESADRTALERVERPTDIGTSDFVIGEFLGDQELLILGSNDSGNEVLIALPLDPREEWYRAGGSVAQFLADYLNAGGEKFWEQSS